MAGSSTTPPTGNGSRAWKSARADDRKLITHLEDVRKRAGIGEDISVLRVLDTAAWLHVKDAM
ncbi:DUF6308 family protein [Streptomyces sp. NPDC005336]|uniref:DUF6308 family protein n=1 Tax=Streptomyces sp. NPDC005336 TaxID=3157035 RepID=UPI0033B95EB3